MTKSPTAKATGDRDSFARSRWRARRSSVSKQRTCSAKESINIGSLIGSWSRSGDEAQVKQKSERPTNSRNTADDVGAIDGTAVPSAGSSVGGVDKDDVGASIIGSDSESFIKKTVKVFDRNGFVVAPGSDVDVDMENIADGLEQTLQGAAIVDDDKTAEANLQKDLLDEQAS
jgi:hypothetical protein